MAEKFTLAGIKADYLHRGNSEQRVEKRQKLESEEISYLFVVDIFNEGVDIKEIDKFYF